MTARPERHHERSRSFGELLRDLVHAGTDMLRGEAKLARMELTDVASHMGRGAGLAALGGVLLLLGGLSLAAGFVLLAGDQWLPRDRYWLAALIVASVAGAAALLLARRGMRQLAPAQLAPDETLETLKEDRQWLKRQLTSGATSS